MTSKNLVDYDDCYEFDDEIGDMIPSKGNYVMMGSLDISKNYDYALVL